MKGNNASASRPVTALTYDPLTGLDTLLAQLNNGSCLTRYSTDAG